MGCRGAAGRAGLLLSMQCQLAAWLLPRLSICRNRALKEQPQFNRQRRQHKQRLRQASEAHREIAPQPVAVVGADEQLCGGQRQRQAAGEHEHHGGQGGHGARVVELWGDQVKRAWGGLGARFDIINACPRVPLCRVMCCKIGWPGEPGCQGSAAADQHTVGQSSMPTCSAMSRAAKPARPSFKVSAAG